MAGTNLKKMPTRVKDEAGKVYGKLTVLEYTGQEKFFAMWRCRCECGREITVRGNNLRTSTTSSCGCIKIKHGCATSNRTPEYRCWQAMRSRCTNANCRFYHNYGGRGITVCDRWHGKDGFANFLADIGPRPSAKHSLDRKDNNGNYEPGNCRWATKEQQDNNRRTSRLLTFRGKMQSITQWARTIGIHPVTLHLRLKNGWSIEKALTTKRQEHCAPIR